MPALRWIHISDIHFGRPRGELDQQEVARQLTSDACARASEIGCPDIIFVTGDVTHEGIEQQFVAGANWIIDLVRHLRIPPHRLFIVPGNHDVDRTKISYLAGLAHDHLRSNTAQLDEFLKNENDTTYAFWPKLEEYTAFCRRVDAPEATPAQPGWQRTLHLRPGRIVIVGLNSVLLSRDNEDQTKMALGRKQLDLIPRNDKYGFYFVLVHHPLSWLSQDSRKHLEIALKQKASLLLFGHSHQENREIVLDSENQGFVELGAATTRKV